VAKGKETISKILVLDIETRPTKAWVWKGFKENIGPDQIIEPGRMICFGAKWHGQPGVEFYSEWEHGRRYMLEQAARLLEEADLVVGFNHESFDVAHIRAELLQENIDQPGPLTSVDLLKTIKARLRLFSNRLMFVGPYLGIGKKVEHEGFPLWLKVMAGDERAQNRMKKYCVQDVILTDRLYKRLRPIIFNHPNIGHTGHACATCGSTNTQKRGFYYTRTFKIQKNKCNSCKSWFKTTRSKIT
jgi:DNA polymerase elongation subunit (family B)